MNIGEKLKDLRINNNLTRQELAKSLDLTKEDIIDYEDNHKELSPELIKKFSEFYNVSTERLTNDCLSLREAKKGTKDVIVFLLLSMVTIFNTLSVLLLLFFLDSRVKTGIEDGVIRGQYVDKYYTLLFLVPFVGFYLISLYLRLNNKHNTKLIFRVDVIHLFLEIIIGTLAILFYYINIKNMQFISQNLFYSIIGVIYFAIGFSVHPGVNRPKAILGFRSRFTLLNDDAWYKVNVVLSYSMIICAVLFIILNLFIKNYYFIFFLLIPFVITTVYHELLKIRVTKSFC